MPLLSTIGAAAARAFGFLKALVTGGYEVDNSLRFNNGSSDELNFTVDGTPTHQDKGTWSFWIKRARIQNAVVRIFSAYADGGATQTWIRLDADNKLDIANRVSASFNTRLVTNRVFRDPSAWYHIVVAFDSTQATASDRVKLYINGVQETSFGTETYPSQNDNLQANTNGIPITWGAEGVGNDEYFDGYLSEAYFIDGQQLTPSSFGETDPSVPSSGIWIPKAYTGSFGTNGYYLKFANSAALGTDSSGNGNNFTVVNLTSIDQTTDTPTNNFSTMNSVSFNANASVTFTEGNTQVNVSNNADNCTSTFMVSSGKWYWEVKQTVGTLAMIGIRPEGMNYNQSNIFNLTGTNQGYYYYGDTGNIRPANTAYGNTFGVNDIIGVALDLDNNKLYFSKNGTFQNSGVPTSGATGTGAVSIATSGLTWGFSFTSGGASDTIQCNFGNPPFTISSGNADANGYGNFEYAVPSGYYALNTKNLAEYG